MGYLDSFQYFDAPLKRFPASRWQQRNYGIRKCSGGIIGAVTPYINNKVTIAEYPKNNVFSQRSINGVIGAFYEGDNNVPYANSALATGLVGGIAPLGAFKGTQYSLQSIVKPYKATSPVYYYRFETLADHLKRTVTQDLTTIKRIVRERPLLGYANEDINDTLSIIQHGGRIVRNVCSNVMHMSGIVGSEGTSVLSPTFLESDVMALDDVKDWIVVYDFKLFDGETLPRKQNDYKIPTIFYYGDATWWLGNATTAKPSEFSKNYINAITISAPFCPTDRATNSSGIALGSSYISLLGDVLTAETHRGQNKISVADYLTKHIGDPDVQIVAGWSDDSDVRIQGLTGAFTTKALSEPATLDIYAQSTAIYPSPRFSDVLIFRSKEAFEAICADYGLIVTSNLDDAKNMPSDFFPSDGGDVPDGGASSGYPTNNTGSIPNYPDNTSDSIDLHPPNVSALSSAAVYALNVSQSKAFLNWLMTDDFTQNISNLFSDKLSAVGDLKLMPFDLAQHDTSHALASDTITVGNVTGQVGNHRIIDGYNTWVSGGEYQYTAYYGDFNDFERCAYSLFVPYSGIVELNAADVVNKKLRLDYAVDLTSGNATAVIRSNGVVIKTVPATMSVSVPITSTNSNQRQLNNALTAMSVGSGLINGAVSSVASGNVMPLVGAVSSGLQQGITNAMTNPLVTQHTGGFGNGTGLSLPQSAFLIITRQIIAMPSDYKSTVGIPATYRGKISEFVGSGFVSISADKLDIACTQSERDEILSALTRGIYL